MNKKGMSFPIKIFIIAVVIVVLVGFLALGLTGAWMFGVFK